MTFKKFCKDHISLVERISKIEGKLSVLIALHATTIGLITAVLIAILRR